MSPGLCSIAFVYLSYVIGAQCQDVVGGGIKAYRQLASHIEVITYIALACTRRELKVGLTQFHADMLVFLFVRILQGVSGVDDMPRLWITAR